MNGLKLQQLIENLLSFSAWQAKSEVLTLSDFPLRGLVIGVGVAVLFAAPPLASVRRVPPVRVLRRTVEPVPLSRTARLLLGTVLVGGVAGLAFFQTGSARMAVGFTGGALVTTIPSLASIVAHGPLSPVHGRLRVILYPVLPHCSIGHLLVRSKRTKV